MKMNKGTNPQVSASRDFTKQYDNRYDATWNPESGEIELKDPDGFTNTGAYFLGLDFSSNEQLTLEQIGSNTLTASANVDTASFLITQDRLLHFSLSTNSTEQAEVVMSIFNAQGNLVLQMTARANQPNVTETKYLTQGQYSVRYSGRSLTSSPLTNVSYALRLVNLSDVIGTYSTSTNEGVGGTNGGGYTYTGTSNKPTSSYQSWR